MFWRGEEKLFAMSDADLCREFLAHRNGDDHICRLAYLSELKRRGEKTLDALGWPRHDSAKYCNRWTGEIQPYVELYARNANRDFWFFAVLEDWQPCTRTELFRNPHDYEDRKPPKYQTIKQMSLF